MAARQPSAGFPPVNNKSAESTDAASVRSKRLRLTLKGEASRSVLTAPRHRGEIRAACAKPARQVEIMHACGRVMQAAIPLPGSHR